MGEAMIIRAGGAGGNANVIYSPATNIITTNTEWRVPRAKNQEFMVRIFGAGGGCSGTGNGSAPEYWKYRGGGGGGNMNNALLKLNAGDIIPITIGAVTFGGSGGTTSFGTHLSATGGAAGYEGRGGNGGTGGGGAFGPGGTGTYGGGGGGGGLGDGGQGGIYGGGGGGRKNSGKSTGGYGNGGTNTISATDGIDTSAIPDIDFYGNGKGGGIMGGGGGYGGSGGKGRTSSQSYIYDYGGGGGGYGGRGGNGASASYYGLGGGGGGYGNDGSNAKGNSQYNAYIFGGGGGGYGPDGYGHGANSIPSSAYELDMALSSGSTVFGKNGVCIITYMEEI